MDKNIDENKAEPKILLERYSKCYIPIGKIYKSFFESKNIGMESMMRAFSEARDIKDLKDACNSAIQSKKIELENLKKSYESFDEAKKNYCKSFYNDVLGSKEFTLGQWEREYEPLLKAEEENGVTKYQTKRKHIMSMCVFCFIKSPEFGDDKWHLNFIDSGWMENSFEKNKDVDYVSYCDEDGKRRLYRTSEMMFLVNNQSLPHMLIDRTVDSEIQIKLLKDAGFKEFTVQLNDEIDKDSESEDEDDLWKLTIQNKLKIVDEEGNRVSYVNEEYQKLDRGFYRKLKNSGCEYINLAHIDEISSIHPIELGNLHSVIILNKNAKIRYICYDEDEDEIGWDGRSPFQHVENPLTFYCEIGSKVAIDILSKFKNEKRYPEFYNATIVFMNPKLVADYQKNLDDVDNYRKMKEFIKSYGEKEDYFSFRLSECSNLRIEQLLLAQKEFSNTWENFTNFMEIIGVKEKSNVKDIEFTYENNEIGTSDNQNQNQNKKDIELMSANEKEEAKIDEIHNQSKIESKLKNKREMLTQNYNLEENVEKELTQNFEIKKTIEDKDNKIDEPEEDLCIFMRYLKKHWPRIFKFFNTIRCSFSGFFSKLKNKSKNGDKNSSVNTVEINLKQNLLGETLALSSRKKVIHNLNDIETVQPVINQEK